MAGPRSRTSTRSRSSKIVAPRVSFEQPDEALEVHPIAEVLNRIRVGDDFGLTKAGIVFQFNNGDEQTLVVKDFTSEPAKSRTTAALQEMLLLEKLAASPTDSLTYYALRRGQLPGRGQADRDRSALPRHPPVQARVQAWRRPASRMEGEGELATLAELIARQRFNLNRANRLAKHKPADKTIAEDPLKIAGFEETLAGLTREFTEGVEGIVGQRIEPLHAAEEAMLAAIAALDHGQNAQSPAHMGAALRHLIAARDTLRVVIGAGPRREQGDAQLRPHASPEDPQDRRRTRKRPRRSPSKSNNSPRMKTSSTQRSPAS